MGQVDLIRTHFLPWVNVTTPANSNIQAVDFTAYFEIGDTIDVYDVDGNGCIISQLASGLTLVDFGSGRLELSTPVDTTLATGIAKIACRTIDDGQEAVDRLYRRRLRRHTSEVAFLASDWNGKTFLRVVRWGAPGPNEVGPHELPSGVYLVNVYSDKLSSVVRKVEVGIIIDRGSGTITLHKSGLVPAFSGRVEIAYTGN
jgi:hypothetical protein